MSETQKPKQAATVILLRPASSSGFEVFFTRRPDEMAFLGGQYCYPGGRVGKDDFAPAMIARCTGLSPRQAQKILGAHFSPPQALGLWIAAVRELFEEVGVLLAKDGSGAPLNVDPERARRLRERHRALLNRSMSFVTMLESEDLFCDLSGLAIFSHWQTPAQFTTRFDTHFFVAALPEGQVPLATSEEVAHSVWLTPDHAMRLFERGQLPMIFPTFAALRTLADFDSLESVLAEYAAASARQGSAK